MTFFALLIIGMVFCLNYIPDLFVKKQNLMDLKNPVAPFLEVSCLAFMFGVLIEWRGLLKIFKGKIKANYFLMITAVILLFISFIPETYWVLRLGPNFPWYIKILTNPETQPLLNAFSGILLVRSIAG